MLVKYVTTASATIDQMIADIVALATGATIASLSASCDKANSAVQASSTATGWSQIDSQNVTTIGGTGYILSAPAATGATSKILRAYKVNSSQIDFIAYESWNTGTHVGTNPTSAAGGVSLNVSSTYMLFASSRSLMLWGTTSVIAALEFTRDAPYLQSTTYPSFVVAASSGLTSSGGVMYIPRVKNFTTAGDSTGASVQVATLCPRGSTPSTAGPTTTLRDATEALYHEMRPMWVVHTSNGVMGRFYDTVEITRNAGSPFDTYNDGTDSYMLIVSTTAATITVKIT